MTHTTHKIANQILNLMDSRINEMVEEIIKHEVEQHLETGRIYVHSQFAIESIRLSLIIDLLKSVEKYTLSTDVLKALSSDISNKGCFIITATIERDGVDYRYSTHVIIAGGYNIQRMHYRYITTTNLPRIYSNFEMVNAYKAELKRMTTRERMMNEILAFQVRIAETEAKIANEEKVSDYEILSQAPSYFTMEYKDLREGHSFGSEEEFSNWQKEGLQNEIAKFRRDTNWKKQYVSDDKKSIKKLQEKLSKLN
jgi:hypothetical protein